MSWNIFTIWFDFLAAAVDFDVLAVVSFRTLQLCFGKLQDVAKAHELSI